MSEPQQEQEPYHEQEPVPQEEPQEPLKKFIQVSFLELEQKENVGKIKDWFPLLEKAVGRSLPKYIRLEGGVYQDRNGVMHYWPGPHYYLCIPTEFVHLLAEYGTFTYSVEKEVDETTLNNQHSVYYWGPGCKPRLEPKREKPHRHPLFDFEDIEDY